MYDKKLEFNQVVYYVDRSWDVNPKVLAGRFICRDDNYPYTYTILDWIPHDERAKTMQLKRDEFWTDEKEAKAALAEELRQRIIRMEGNVKMMRERMEILLGKRKEEFDPY